MDVPSIRRSLRRLFEEPSEVSPFALELKPDETFDLFASRRQRWVIMHVAQIRTTDLRELARWLAWAEGYPASAPPETVDTTERQHAYSSLYQTHLPALNAAGALEWDERTHEIEANARTRELNRLLQSIYECLDGEPEVAS